jgi:hypothetical protein
LAFRFATHCRTRLNFLAMKSAAQNRFLPVLAALGKTDLFRTHEVPRIKAVLDTLNVLLKNAGFDEDCRS